MDRNKARKIIAEISSYNPYTTFTAVVGTTFKLSTVEGSLAKEQHILALQNHALIAWYISTPPSTKAQCRNRHAVEWTCTQYGIWMCKCYYRQKLRIVDNMIRQGNTNEY